MSEIQPGPSLYLRNLPYPINVEELRRSLYALFATYGEVIDIVTKKEERMREQAFVVYNDVASATAALRSLNGFIFYDKNLKIEYAKTKSDAVAKLDGTYRLRTTDEKKNAKGTDMNVLGKRTADSEDGTPAKLSRQEDESDMEDDDE